ncbi:MAG: efflux RND transporter periplasmic adaptor subunit [Tahibacter sp.]
MRDLPLPRSLLARFSALALCIALPAGAQDPGAEMPPTQVEVAKPTIEALADTLTAVGSLRADEAVTIRPEVAGRIEAVLFEEGQKIVKGAALFRLDASLARADVTEAQANASNSDRELKRAQELVSRKLIAQADVDNKRAQSKVDEAKLSSSRTRLDKTDIRAPFAGTTGLRKVSAGEYVNVGDALVELVALDALKLDFSLPEVHLGKFQPGQAISLRVDAFGSRRFEGEVYAIAPQVDLATRSVTLRARVPNPDGVLRPGQFGNVELTIGSKPNALLVPEQALWPQGAKQYVYLVRDGKAALTEVTTGLRKPGFVEIVSGVGPNDTVVTAGQMKIGPGAKVQPKVAADAAKAPASAPAAH